ncbi:type 2 lanthipeptide synthetase LanM family protein [Bacillus swezeyi]|uniref:type 2 lanthipeptide synthetase LanM family protein n=1 Tax=Bacillus swezeyi TaxID=1925020 RepID=UPI002E1FF82F|nr:type 2 lanthipeptide synthetase LanM family protein [Bacillus swezeyi]
MSSILKNSTYLKERTLSNIVNLSKASRRKNYWLQFFNNNEKSLNDALFQLSKIKITELESIYDLDNFPFEISDELLELENKYFSTPKSDIQLDTKITNDSGHIPFINFYLPFLTIAKELIKDFKIVNRKNFDDLLKSVLKLLYQVANRALILEMNIFRLSVTEDTLTSEERYNYFKDKMLCDEDYLKYFFKEYPVVFRLILYTLINWKKFIRELNTNFINDSDLLNQTFNKGKDLGIVKKLYLGAGDSHNGKSVVIFEFYNNLKLVYKPRSLMIDMQYNKLVNFLNFQQSTNLNFYESTVINRDSYGWTSFIAYEECKNKEQVKNFYTRSGSLIALFYILNATDFHHENLIAQNEHPVPIDLETLFHQNFVGSRMENKEELTALENANYKISHSVKTIGILPNKIFMDKENGIDISGLGGNKKQKSPYKGQVLKNLKTDKIRVDKAIFDIEPEKNNPTVNGGRINILEYMDYIISGFSEFYDWVMKNRELLKKEIAKFENTENRYILRNTNQYARLLNQSLHPDFLKNGLDRDIFLHRLSLNKVNSQDMLKIFAKEKKELLNLNIPYFTTVIDKTHLNIDNNLKIPNFFNNSSLKQSYNKIDNLSEEDKHFQTNIINLSIIASEPSNDRNPFSIDYSKKLDHIPKVEYLKEAITIGDYILSQAIEGKINNKDDFCWISTIFSGTEESNWKVNPVGVDLYNGNAGLTIFFSQLAQITESKYYKEVSYNIANGIRVKLSNASSSELINQGAFDGWVGCIYSLHILGETFNDNDIRQEVIKYIDNLVFSIDKIKDNDVISGAAGYLGILLTIYTDTKVPSLLRAAEKIAELIINNAQEYRKGINWLSPNDKKSFTGFAHGSSGITAMLARLYCLNKSSELLSVIKKALTFERRNYSDLNHNWKSYEDVEKYQYAWCHGAPGILLNRLILKSCGYNDELIDEEIFVAIKTTLEKCISYNHSLCHGNFGQIEILDLANRMNICYPNLSHKIDLIKEHVIRDIQGKKYINLRSKRTDVQGLMNGLAGYGFGLLNSYSNNRLPIILILGPNGKRI